MVTNHNEITLKEQIDFKTSTYILQKYNNKTENIISFFLLILNFLNFNKISFYPLQAFKKNNQDFKRKTNFCWQKCIFVIYLISAICTFPFLTFNI